MPNKSRSTVVVAGDVMVDWNVTVNQDELLASRSWREAGHIKRDSDPGGAWLFGDLIELFAQHTAPVEWRVCMPQKPSESGRYAIHQTYSVLSQYGKERVWRIQAFYGVEKHGNGGLRLARADNDPKAGIVALLDSDLGFDGAPTEFPSALTTENHTPWVVLKTSVPAYKERLWRHLIKRHAQRLIVVTTADDLRRRGVQLLRRVSWERTALDVARELRENPVLRPLNKAEYVTISFGTAGVMLFSRNAPPRLVFDRTAMEGEWEPSENGDMIGYTTVLATVVVYELMIHYDDPQLVHALPGGIAAMRKLFETGYGSGETPKLNLLPIWKASQCKPHEVAATVTIPLDAPPSWTILEQRVKATTAISPDKSPRDVVYELAARVAVFGSEAALAEVPQLKIGELFTVDRSEIEAYRSVKTLLDEYVNRTQATEPQPFSIAVFGAPGSGKSFGVTQIAKYIADKKIKKLTFNLTQFERHEELHGAFHQVRDEALRGNIPLVFWDEFDTTYENQPLGWLRFFIGPMQDGVFTERQIPHPLGTSIFVFAGGTARSKDEFVAAASGDLGKQMKAPDFISRLKGYLDLTGVNPRGSDLDPQFMLRRAVLLRSMVQKHCPELIRGDELQIDPGVLHAFLTTRSYRHGARSLESLIAMSTLGHRKKFEGSSLPPEPQMALHVDGPFETVAYKLRFTDDVDLLENLAAIAHDVFRKAKRKSNRRWKYHPVRNDALYHHDLLLPYGELSEHDKESNRANIRDIPRKLATEGFSIAPVGTVDEDRLSSDQVMRLAEREHERWMSRKLAAGYTHGKEVSESPQKSPYLVPWSDLSPELKQIDTAFIKAIPKILREAGYIIVRKKP